MTNEPVLEDFEVGVWNYLLQEARSPKMIKPVLMERADTAIVQQHITEEQRTYLLDIFNAYH